MASAVLKRTGLLFLTAALVIVAVPRSPFGVPRSVLVPAANVERGTRNVERTIDMARTDVPTFGGNAQHTAVYSVPAAELNAIRWSTPIDLHPTGGFAHYGAPLVTAGNSVIVPVKT